MEQLETTIEKAFEYRANITPRNVEAKLKESISATQRPVRNNHFCMLPHECNTICSPSVDMFTNNELQSLL